MSYSIPECETCGGWRGCSVEVHHRAGAAIAFGLMGMAHAIRDGKANEEVARLRSAFQAYVDDTASCVAASAFGDRDLGLAKSVARRALATTSASTAEGCELGPVPGCTHEPTHYSVAICMLARQSSPDRSLDHKG